MIENYIKEKKDQTKSSLIKRLNWGGVALISLMLVTANYYPKLFVEINIVSVMCFWFYLLTNKHCSFFIEGSVISYCVENKGFIKKLNKVLEKDGIEYELKFLDEQPVLIRDNKIYDINSF